LMGIACTASLASDRPKRGPHRAHLALQTSSRTLHRHVELIKGRRSREEEERLVSGLILNLLAEACGIESRIHVDAGLHDGEPLDSEQKLAPIPWQRLLLGRLDCLKIDSSEHGTWRVQDAAARTGRVLLCGAFNPLHDGHRQMAQIGAARTGSAVELELSLTNVEKPPLDYLELDRRLSSTAGPFDLWLTRAATFAEKSELFPGATFVVGADTVVRIADPRYYANDSARRDAALARLVEQGCRFLVFGRLLNDRFEVLGDLGLPPALGQLCEEVPEHEFRVDISSTRLRAGGEGP